MCAAIYKMSRLRRYRNPFIQFGNRIYLIYSVIKLANALIQSAGELNEWKCEVETIASLSIKILFAHIRIGEPHASRQFFSMKYNFN